MIRAQVTDSGQVRDAIDLWYEQLAIGADGWLGSTAGVTEDGRFVALARFETEHAARRNSDRPEQHQWWMETAKLFTGEVTFSDSSDVTVDLHGNPDAADYVRVIQGRSGDPARARDLRPEVLGSVAVGHEGGGYTMAIYFASEQAAREGERKEPPLSAGEPEFLDLRQPWLYSP